MWCFSTQAWAQIDTAAIFHGQWDLVYSSIGFPGVPDDTNYSYSDVKDYKLVLTISDKTLDFKSVRMLRYFNDSIVNDDCYKYRRSQSFLSLTKKKHRRLLYIEKINFNELVLTETLNNTIQKQSVEYRYYFKKRDSIDYRPRMTGRWLLFDTCSYCSFWRDTIELVPAPIDSLRYGTTFSLDLKTHDKPHVAQNQYVVNTNYRPTPDTTSKWSAYESYTWGHSEKRNQWIYNPLKQYIYFYTDYVTNEYYTYRIDQHLPGQKLRLIRLD